MTQRYNWSAPSTNPFYAISSVVRPQDVLKLSSTMNLVSAWRLFDEKNFLDDLLQEIAGATNIVVQKWPDGLWRACYDEPVSGVPNET